MLFHKTKTLLYVSTIYFVLSFCMSVLQHYLSYLNYLRVNEYCGAIESLHHYFDCHLVDFSKTNDSAKSKQEDEVSCRGFRYAALSMAALQYRFGHRWVVDGATGAINLLVVKHVFYSIHLQPYQKLSIICFNLIVKKWQFLFSLLPY